MGLHALGDGRQPVLDTANVRRERLRQRQAEHGERAIGLDVEQALHQRAASGLGEAAVDDENAGQPVAVLAKIGEHGRLAVLDIAVTEACQIEELHRRLDLGPVTADLQPDARHQRTRRGKTVAEGVDENFAAEGIGQRTVPEPGGEFGVALPAQRSLAPGHGVVAGIAIGHGHAAGSRQLGKCTVMHGRSAVHHEGQLHDHALRFHQRIGPRMDLAQRQCPLRRHRKCETTLPHQARLPWIIPAF